ncbi:MAG: glycosyltransferase family A protein [Promethearchaeota archaeon]
MKLLIQFPTRGRSKQFGECLETYIDYLDPLTNWEEVEVHVSMDTNDGTMNDIDTINWLESFNAVVNMTYTYYHNKHKHEAVNRGIKEREWDICLLASDDMWPQISSYNKMIEEDMQKHFPDTDGALWYYDGNRKDINTLQIMGRKYFDRFGYIYREETFSFYGDTEYQAVAQKLNKLQYIDTCLIKHVHPDYHPDIERDESYQTNQKNWEHDTMVFMKRKAMRFPL